MASRYTQYNQANPQSMFVPQNLDLTYKALENKQHIQDVNEETGNALKDYILKTPGLTEEDKRANQVKAQEVDKAMDDIHSKYQGDLTQATSDIKNLVRKYKYDPELQARTSNYNAAISHFENVDKDNALNSKYKSSYKNQVIGNYGATRKQADGSYNQIQLPGYNPIVDESKKLGEFLDKVKPETEEQKIQLLGRVAYDQAVRTGTVEELTKQKLLQTGLQFLQNDPELVNSFAQRNQFEPGSGYDKWDINHPGVRMLDAMSTARAYKKVDPHYNFLEDYGAKLALKSAQEKKDNFVTPTTAIGGTATQNVLKDKMPSEFKYTFDDNGNIKDAKVAQSEALQDRQSKLDAVYKEALVEAKQKGLPLVSITGMNQSRYASEIMAKYEKDNHLTTDEVKKEAGKENQEKTLVKSLNVMQKLGIISDKFNSSNLPNKEQFQEAYKKLSGIYGNKAQASVNVKIPDDMSGAITEGLLGDKNKASNLNAVGVDGKLENLDTVLAEQYGADNVEKIRKSGRIVEYTPQGDAPGAMKMVYTDPDGLEQSLVISTPTLEQKQYFGNSFEVNSKVNNFFKNLDLSTQDKELMRKFDVPDKLNSEDGKKGVLTGVIQRGNQLESIYTTLDEQNVPQTVVVIDKIEKQKNGSYKTETINENSLKDLHKEEATNWLNSTYTAGERAKIKKVKVDVAQPEE